MSDRSHNASGISTDDDSAPSLADALLLTERMLVLARANDWDSVTNIEKVRRAAIESCFAQPISEEQSGIFTEALAAMLQMNEELVSILEIAREEVSIKRSKQGHIKRSLTHYLDVESKS